MTESRTPNAKVIRQYSNFYGFGFFAEQVTKLEVDVGYEAKARVAGGCPLKGGESVDVYHRGPHISGILSRACGNCLSLNKQCKVGRLPNTIQ